LHECQIGSKLGILMKIGLISDTHNKLHQDITTIFKDMDLILHAGDIGGYDILEKLQGIASTKAVYGNTDIYSIASTLPSQISMQVEGKQLLLIHNIGNVKNFVWKIRRGDYPEQPEIVVFGHTHRPSFDEYMDFLFINPGSASFPRRESRPSIMILEITKNGSLSHKVITLPSHK